MDAAILQLIGQLGTAGIFVFACYRIYTDSAAERESFHQERLTWVKILERLDATNNALIMAIENQNTLSRIATRRYYQGTWNGYGPEPNINTDADDDAPTKPLPSLTAR